MPAIWSFTKSSPVVSVSKPKVGSVFVKDLMVFATSESSSSDSIKAKL
jgi:hypothetical protein